MATHQATLEEMNEGYAASTEMPPHFPISIFLVAVFKDLIDIAGMSIVGIFMTPLFWLIIYMWLGFKVGKRKQRLMRHFVRRSWVALIGFIPVVNAFVPEATLIVITLYRHEKKLYREGKSKRSVLNA